MGKYVSVRGMYKLHLKKRVKNGNKRMVKNT